MTIMATLGTGFPNPNYQWDTTNGLISGTATTAQITALEPGTYTVTVVNPANSCSDTESVTLTENVLPPNAIAGSDQELTCTVSAQSLGGNSSSGNNISYTWTSTNGTLTAADSLINVLATAPGTYVLEVLNTDNFCTDLDTVIVTQDIQSPFAQITPPEELTCTDSLSVLDGSGSGGAASLAFAWSTTNGSLVGNASTVQVNAGQAGMYQLVVTNTDNGCTDTTQTNVIQDENFPQANITISQTLTCTRLFVNLSGTASSNSGNVNFSWSTADGNITAGANTLQPEVSSAGNYVLTVEDTDNNCTAQASIQVLLDDTPPTVNAGLDTLLNCNITQLQLAATADAQGAGLTYDWSTMNGNLTAGATTATPDINAAGTYLVEVINTTNGCTASDEVQVTLDTISPTIQILPPSVLTCADTLANLDASGSTAGSAPIYAWTSPNGQNIEAADTPVASVMQAGTYTLLVTNTDNGCTQQSIVMVTDNLTPPIPLLSVSDTLDCATFSLDLDATQSTGTSLSYAWSNTDNLTINDPTSATPAVQQAGVYDLLLTDGENGCTATASITVEDNSEIPLFMIQEPIAIDCNNPIIQLAASTASNIGDNPTYNWTTLGGNLVQDETTLTPTIDEAGSYILTVINNDNGCVGTDTILVRDDLENPVIQIDSVEELNCTVLTVGVNATGSSGNGPLTFSWQSPDGNIISAPDEDNITVDAPGAYGLLLLNTNNGCTDSLGITVTQDTIQPQLTIAAPAILDCDTESFMLDANGSSTGPNLEINWTTSDGQIDGGANSLEPTISQPGVYTLEIINTANTCTNSTEVTVTQDDDVPTILFASPEELNCVLLMTDLDASASSVGSTLIYTWTTINGNFTGGTAGLTPTVNAPGTYTLTIENPDNNCENSANVVVMQDIMPPIAQAGSDFVLDCTVEQDDLDGTASSQGGNFSYRWTAAAGSIIQEANTLTPTIDAPDSYQLLVTNNDNGCTATDVIIITEDIPTAVLDAVQPLCFGDNGTITFTGTQGGTPPYLYTIDGGNSLQLQPLFSNLPPGVYSALIEDSNGCTYSETIEIDEPDSLYTLITNLESELEIKFGDSVRLTAQVNYPIENLTVISWQDSTTLSCGNCLAPYALPTQTSLYQLTVISENGCTDEALVRVFVNREFPVYFPTGFSPNGDGDNDVFYPFAELGAVTKVHEFQIFDRWGNLMHYTQSFSPNDPFYGWDGEQNGVPMNPAVFVYFAEVEFADGRIEIFKGDVTLVR
jgi:gliding motility-associated-like protein